MRRLDFALLERIHTQRGQRRLAVALRHREFELDCVGALDQSKEISQLLIG